MLPVTVSMIATGSLLLSIEPKKAAPMTTQDTTEPTPRTNTGDFHSAVRIILSKRIEGGYVNDLRDNGGATNMGISLREVRRMDADRKLDRYLRTSLDVDKDGDIDEADVPKWSEPIALYFYRQHYWETIRGSELPHPIALMTFDSAVNEGCPRAAMHLQRSIGGIEVDGIVGPATIDGAWRLYEHRLMQHFTLEEKIFISRVNRYRTLDDADTFFAGWLNRALTILKACQS